MALDPSDMAPHARHPAVAGRARCRPRHARCAPGAPSWRDTCRVDPIMAKLHIYVLLHLNKLYIYLVLQSISIYMYYICMNIYHIYNHIYIYDYHTSTYIDILYISHMISYIECMTSITSHITAKRHGQPRKAAAQRPAELLQRVRLPHRPHLARPPKSRGSHRKYHETMQRSLGNP